jgi:large subunit ribosomal protein L19
MSRLAIIEKLEKDQLKKNIPNFRVGDTVKVHTRIIEGEKERIQVFTGTVIARKGTGLAETFSVHRVAYGEGMERVFPLHSPRISKIEVVKEGHVRRSKLYYLRGTSGKKSKVRGRMGTTTRTGQQVEQSESEPAQLDQYNAQENVGSTEPAAEAQNA